MKMTTRTVVRRRKRGRKNEHKKNNIIFHIVTNHTPFLSITLVVTTAFATKPMHTHPPNMRLKMRVYLCLLSP